jgi:hypothetical protein
VITGVSYAPAGSLRPSLRLGGGASRGNEAFEHVPGPGEVTLFPCIDDGLAASARSSNVTNAGSCCVVDALMPAFAGRGLRAVRIKN